MMYDELIRGLRMCEDGEKCDLCPKWLDKQNGGLNACTSALSKDAADAIEELKKDLEQGQDYYEFWKHKAEQGLKMLQVAISNMPCWIPVTERLPEYMENVLVTDGVFSGMGWRDYYDCHGTKPREDYWIAPSTNVNELGITHWKPLPQPPKDGEA